MFNEPGLSHALLLALVVSALYALRKRLPGTQLGRSQDQFESPQARRRRRQLIALECTELALAGVFFLVGGAKLIGRHDMVELFRAREHDCKLEAGRNSGYSSSPLQAVRYYRRSLDELQMAWDVYEAAHSPEA